MVVFLVCCVLFGIAMVIAAVVGGPRIVTVILACDAILCAAMAMVNSMLLDKAREKK